MPAYKDKAKGTWYASFYYEDWTGKKVKKMKRGFPTKREALEWERTFLQQQTADLEMTFENFVAVYVADMKGRIKENTWGTKEHILYKKLVPYFGKRKMCDIHSKEVIAWQNEMLGYRDKNGKPYSPVYLKTLHNQLSAVFNHAVRHYNLKVNPAAQAGNMGKPKGREMLFWTKAEYLKFAEAMMDKPLSYYAFEMLYWCGVREGELLALTPGDFDFEKQTVTISKSYQRIKGKDVITDPKTPKSNRVIQMPAFLCEEMRDYILIGVGIGALIHNWIPESWIETVLGSNNPFGVILATIVGIPMYADIFGTIPVAEALLSKGAQLGTVLSFMMAVTTLSLPSLIMLRKAVKPKLLALFIGVCAVGIILVGYLFNAFQFILI